MTVDEITTGELSRRLDKLERHMDTGFSKVSAQIENLKFVTRSEYQVQVKTLEFRIEELEESKKWMSRALVGAVITSILIPALLLLLGLPV